MFIKLLQVIHIICAVGVIALVLVQRGRGAEAGAGFGAGASGTVFGARGARTALSRMTAVLAAVFMVTSLSLAYFGTRKAGTTTSTLDRIGAEQPQTPTAAGTAPATAPAAAPAPATTVPATAPAPAGK